MKYLQITALSTFVSFLLFFAPSNSGAAESGQVNLKGTDSAGSYSYDAGKSEGSKSKAPSHGGGAINPHSKKEGSKGYAKSHPHKKKECDGKKEGSKGKSYAHKKKECDGKYAHKGPGHGVHGKKYRGHNRHHSGQRQYGHGGGGHKGHGQSPFKHVLKFKNKLGLTEGQVSAIKDAEFLYKKEKVRTHADHKIAHMELDRLVHSGKIDEPGMKELANRISAIKSRSIHSMVEAKLALLKILTPEQRKKINHIHGAH